MEHTPGDWKLGQFHYPQNGEIGRCEIRKDMAILAHVYLPAKNQTGFGIGRANARLIAAAPSLLKALQGDEENCIPNAQTILSQALLGNYEAVKSMLSELCSIHAKAINKTK